MSRDLLAIESILKQPWISSDVTDDDMLKRVLQTSNNAVELNSVFRSKQSDFMAMSQKITMGLRSDLHGSWRASDASQIIIDLLAQTCIKAAKAQATADSITVQARFAVKGIAGEVHLNADGTPARETRVFIFSGDVFKTLRSFNARQGMYEEPLDEKNIVENLVPKVLPIMMEALEPKRLFFTTWDNDFENNKAVSELIKMYFRIKDLNRANGEVSLQTFLRSNFDTSNTVNIKDVSFLKKFEAPIAKKLRTSNVASLVFEGTSQIELRVFEEAPLPPTVEPSLKVKLALMSVKEVKRNNKHVTIETFGRLIHAIIGEERLDFDVIKLSFPDEHMAEAFVWHVDVGATRRIIQGTLYLSADNDKVFGQDQAAINREYAQRIQAIGTSFCEKPTEIWTVDGSIEKGLITLIRKTKKKKNQIDVRDFYNSVVKNTEKGEAKKDGWRLCEANGAK